MHAFPIEDSHVINHRLQVSRGLEKDAFTYLASVLLREVHFFMKQKQTTIKK